MDLGLVFTQGFTRAMARVLEELGAEVRVQVALNSMPCGAFAIGAALLKGRETRKRVSGAKGTPKGTPLDPF